MIARMLKLNWHKIQQIGWLKSNQKSNLKQSEHLEEINTNLFSNIFLLFSNPISLKEFTEKYLSSNKTLDSLFQNNFVKKQTSIKNQSIAISKIEKDFPQNENALFPSKFVGKEEKNKFESPFEPKLSGTRPGLEVSLKEFESQEKIPIVSKVTFKKEDNLISNGKAEIVEHFPIEDKILKNAIVKELESKFHFQTAGTNPDLSDKTYKVNVLCNVDNLQEKIKNDYLFGKSGKNQLENQLDTSFPNESIGENFLKINDETSKKIEESERGEKDELETLGVERLTQSKIPQSESSIIKEVKNTEGKVYNELKQATLRLVNLPEKVATLISSSKEFPVKAEIHLQPKWLGEKSSQMEQKKETERVKNILSVPSHSNQSENVDFGIKYNGTKEQSTISGKLDKTRKDNIFEKTVQVANKGDYYKIEEKQIEFSQGCEKKMSKETKISRREQSQVSVFDNKGKKVVEYNSEKREASRVESKKILTNQENRDEINLRKDESKVTKSDVGFDGSDYENKINENKGVPKNLNGGIQNTALKEEVKGGREGVENKRLEVSVVKRVAVEGSKDSDNEWKEKNLTGELSREREGGSKKITNESFFGKNNNQEHKIEQTEVENWTKEKVENNTSWNERIGENYRTQRVGENKIAEENSLKMPKQGTVRVIELPSKVATLISSSKEFPVKAEIHLQPKWLGMVIVELNVVNDKVEVAFKSDNKETLQILENQIHFLREKLQNLGFERQSFTFQNQIENKDNPFGQFSSRQGRQEDEELKRKFLQSFQKLRNTNENFVLDIWGENDYKH